MKLKLEEMFVSIQGESFATCGIKKPFGAGILTLFIRTYGCNFNCKYCDTGYSTKAEVQNKTQSDLSVEDIVKNVVNLINAN